MKKILFLALFLFALGTCIVGQDTSSTESAIKSDKPKQSPIFRANKDQITQAQTLLKAKAFYAGDASGKLDATTRASIKLYQKENGLKPTGTLNRATLEKMGIALTDKQKEMPVNPNSFASTGDKAKSEDKSADAKPKKRIFRATKDQISAAQKILRSASMYLGEETGNLDDATRDGLKKYQQANDLKVTGTLNQVTLEKMGIELTDKQKELE